MEPVLVWTHTSPPHMWDADSIGYLASALVLITFSVRSMRALRLFTVASNVAFVAYASIEVQPLILHGILLPMNIIRLERRRGTRRFTSVHSGHWECVGYVEFRP
jgi:hypothetical protein